MPYAMTRSNAHTHTFRCNHASGHADDYCRSALQAGLSVLGFSDHTPLPDSRWPSVRMDLTELPGYCREISAARKHFPELAVLAGLECEYDAAYVGFYRDELLGRYRLDYLVGAAHWYPHQGTWLPLYGAPMGKAEIHSYTDYLITAMASGLFVFLAHPDLFGNAYLNWDAEAVACSRQILASAADLNLPLEINGYGFRKPMVETPTGRRRKYPLEPFWELAAEFPVAVITNSDAHAPEDVAASIEESRALARMFGLRIVEMGPDGKLRSLDGEPAVERPQAVDDIPRP